ncbi:uncharacterized protein M6D78_015792 [Vipera latastei]
MLLCPSASGPSQSNPSIGGGGGREGGASQAEASPSSEKAAPGKQKKPQGETWIYLRTSGEQSCSTTPPSPAPGTEKGRPCLRAQGETLEETQHDPLRPIRHSRYRSRRSSRSRSDWLRLPGRREGKEAPATGPWAPRLPGSSKPCPAPGKRRLAARKGHPAAPPKPRRAPEAPSRAPSDSLRGGSGPGSVAWQERGKRRSHVAGFEQVAAPKSGRSGSAFGPPRSRETSRPPQPATTDGLGARLEPPPDADLGRQKGLPAGRVPLRSGRRRRRRLGQLFLRAHLCPAAAGQKRPEPPSRRSPAKLASSSRAESPGRAGAGRRAGRAAPDEALAKGGRRDGGGAAWRSRRAKEPPRKCPSAPSAGRAGGAALGRSLIGREGGRDPAEAARARPWQLLLALPGGPLPAPVSRPPKSRSQGFACQPAKALGSDSHRAAELEGTSVFLQQPPQPSQTAV